LSATVCEAFGLSLSFLWPCESRSRALADKVKHQGGQWFSSRDVGSILFKVCQLLRLSIATLTSSTMLIFAFVFAFCPVSSSCLHSVECFALSLKSHCYCDVEEHSSPPVHVQSSMPLPMHVALPKAICMRDAQSFGLSC